MFITYEPNIKATITFLKLLKVRVNNTTVNETLLNHPDWPSLLSISDSLNNWNIVNSAGKTEVKNIDQIPTPFLACTKNPNTVAIVKEVTGSSIQVFENNYKKYLTVNREKFLNRWTGVYLFAETLDNSGDPLYDSIKRKRIINSLISFTAVAVLISITFLWLNRIVPVNRISVYFQYLISLVGVFTSILLLWYEIDKKNILLNKVCTGMMKGNCNAILSSKQSKLFNWISWSEIGFYYFMGGVLVLLFAKNNFINSIALMGWLNILALPYTIFSVYYQWRVAKQWCVLCLTVQLLLLLGSINVIINNYLFPIPQFSFSFLLQTFLVYMVPVLLWYFIKPNLLRLQDAKDTKRQYLRIKFNIEIFETLLKKQKDLTIPIDGLGIDLGESDAKNTIIKVCSPYCDPCSKAHPKIHKLLEELPHLRVKIIFTTPNQPEERGYKLVSHLLAISEQKNEENLRQALDDWYLTDVKDYEVFAKKYPMNGELKNQGDKIELMEKWCTGMEINYTPTILINGYQLPDAYSIEDLKYFLLE